MNKRALLQCIEWAVAIVACGFLVWKIATYDDYSALWDTLRGIGAWQWVALAVCVALMPVNMLLEAWRWKTLIPMSWREANRQVYYSKLAGLVTPWRLGEYPARGLLMEQAQHSDISTSRNGETSESIWPTVLSMGAVGSVTMTAAIVIAGVIGLSFSPSVLACLGGSYLYSLLAVVLILGGLFLLMPHALKKYVELNQDLLIRSVGQSLVRLACWCVQLFLVLFALGAISNFQFSIFNLPLYYLLVTITPNVPIVEVGVRGAWAIFVFGSMNAGLAGVLLWGINTLLPCVVWFFLRKTFKC